MAFDALVLIWQVDMMKQWDITKKCKTALFSLWIVAVLMILMREQLFQLLCLIF